MMTMTMDEQANFEKMVTEVTHLELLDLLMEFSQSDDWDGAFTDDQSWKQHVCYVELANRLAKLS